MVIEKVVDEVIAACETGSMIPSPPSSYPGFDLNAAYAVESALKHWRESAGHRAVGRKVGYANKAMWRVLKLETLVWGHMYDDTVHYAVDNSTSITIPRPRSLKIEPEIVFGLRSSIASEGLDATGALGAVEWLAIGFEIIDCPFPDWKFQPSDFVASFGLHAGLIVGQRLPVRSESMTVLADQLSVFKVRMFKSDNFVEEGSGRNSLRSPALCLAELGAAVLRRTPHEPLAAGELVSSGTLTAGHSTEAGDLWRVEVVGLDLPALSLRLI